jgi:hypothetical protein
MYVITITAIIKGKPIDFNIARHNAVALDLCVGTRLPTAISFGIKHMTWVSPTPPKNSAATTIGTVCLT